MAVEIYKGKYVTAEEATNYIDVATIRRSCLNMKEAVSQLEHTSKRVANAHDFCRKDALSVGGMNMEEKTENLAVEYSDVAHYMDVFSDTVLGALQKALDAKQNELNIKAQREEMRIMRQLEQKQQLTRTMIN